MSIPKSAFIGLCWCLALLFPLQAVRAVPQLINFQGRIQVSGADYTGSGDFKFALVDKVGATTYWSNDGTSLEGAEPTDAVPLTVSNGLYTVLLGDANLTNMTAIPASVFANEEVYLRIWFDDGTNGSQRLSPDQRIAAVGYAMMAASATTVPDGAITSAKLADSAVTSGKVADGAIGSTQLADGSVTAAKLAGPISTPAIQAGTFAVPSTTDPQDFTVTFPEPFMKVPIVTITSRFRAAWGITNVTATGFEASIDLPLKGSVSSVAGDFGNENGGARITIVDLGGKPAIGYSSQSPTRELVKLAVNSSANGKGSWSFSTVDTGSNSDGDPSLAVVNGKPAFSYRNTSNGELRFAINANADGTGSWTSTVVAQGPEFHSLAEVDGRPAICYSLSPPGGTSSLFFAINSEADGSGNWTITMVDPFPEVGFHNSMTIVNGKPAICYTSLRPSHKSFKFAINTRADGRGTWRRANINLNNAMYTSLAVVDGKPAVSYWFVPSPTHPTLSIAIASTADGLGPWNGFHVDGDFVSPQSTSLTTFDGKPMVAYDGGLFVNTEADGRGAWNGTEVGGPHVSLTMIKGAPMAGFSDGSKLKFWTQGAEVDVHWIAIEQ